MGISAKAAAEPEAAEKPEVEFCSVKGQRKQRRKWKINEAVYDGNQGVLGSGDENEIWELLDPEM